MLQNAINRQRNSVATMGFTFNRKTIQEIEEQKLLEQEASPLKIKRSQSLKKVDVNRSAIPLTMSYMISYFNRTNRRGTDEVDERIQQYLINHFLFIRELSDKIKPELMNELISELTYQKIDQLDVLFNAGDIGRQMYLILQGEIGILISKRDEEIDTQLPSNPNLNHQTDQNEKAHIQNTFMFEKVCENLFPRMQLVNVLGPDQDFGQVALQHRIPRTATTIAQCKTDLLVLTYDTYRRIIGRYFADVQQQQIEFLRRVPFFSQISAAGLFILLSNCQLVTHPFNGFIFKEGEVADKVFIIKQGLVQIQKLIKLDSKGQPEEVGNYEDELDMQDDCELQSKFQQKIKFQNLNDAGPGQMIGHYEVISAYFKDQSLFSQKQDLPRRFYRATVKEKTTVLVLSASNLINNSQHWNYEHELNEIQKIKQEFRDQQKRNNQSRMFQRTQKTGYNFDALLHNNINGIYEFKQELPNQTNKLQIIKMIKQKEQMSSIKHDYSKQIYEDLVRKFSFAIPYRESPFLGDPQQTIKHFRIKSQFEIDQIKKAHQKISIQVKSQTDENIDQIDTMKIFAPDPTDPQCRNLVQQLETFKNQIQRLKEGRIKTSSERKSYVIYSPRSTGYNDYSKMDSIKETQSPRSSPLKIMFFKSDKTSPISGQQGYKFFPSKEKMILDAKASTQIPSPFADNISELVDDLKHSDLFTPRNNSVYLNEKLLNTSRDKKQKISIFSSSTHSEQLIQSPQQLTSYQQYQLKNEKEYKPMGIQNLNINLQMRNSVYNSLHQESLTTSKVMLQSKYDQVPPNYTPRTSEYSSAPESLGFNIIKINDLNHLMKINRKKSQEKIHQFIPSNIK